MTQSVITPDQDAIVSEVQINARQRSEYSKRSPILNN
jgi:hypothetical protein